MESIFSPATQALLAGLASWFSIALGAAFIYTSKEFSRSFLQIMLGAAGGMMLGATFFALLSPSLELSQAEEMWTQFSINFSFIPTLTGLALGALFLRLFDAFLPHGHEEGSISEGIQTSWNSSILLVTAMALHHIPEGLAMGVSYGALNSAHATEALSFNDTLVLTLSMMLQGIPEGTVVAMTLLRQGLHTHKAFFYGVLSGCTTPLGALLGLWCTDLAAQFLPVALAFAAGAMLYIIVEDIIPESQASGHGNAATLAVIGGLMLVIIFQTVFSA